MILCPDEDRRTEFSLYTRQVFQTGAPDYLDNPEPGPDYPDQGLAFDGLDSADVVHFLHEPGSNIKSRNVVAKGWDPRL